MDLRTLKDVLPTAAFSFGVGFAVAVLIRRQQQWTADRRAELEAAGGVRPLEIWADITSDDMQYVERTKALVRSAKR